MIQPRLAWIAFKNMMRTAARDPIWAFLNLIGMPFRIAACLPSYAAAALAFGLALERGLSARYAPDLLVLAVILAFQGRAFAAHISTSLHPSPVPALRSRIVVRLREGALPPGE